MDKTGSIVHDDIPGVSGCLLFTGIYWGNPSPGVPSIGAERPLQPDCVLFWQHAPHCGKWCDNSPQLDYIGAGNLLLPHVPIDMLRVHTSYMICSPINLYNNKMWGNGPIAMSNCYHPDDARWRLYYSYQKLEACHLGIMDGINKHANHSNHVNNFTQAMASGHVGHAKFYIDMSIFMWAICAPLAIRPCLDMVWW